MPYLQRGPSRSPVYIAGGWPGCRRTHPYLHLTCLGMFDNIQVEGSYVCSLNGLASSASASSSALRSTSSTCRFTDAWCRLGSRLVDWQTLAKNRSSASPSPSPALPPPPPPPPPSPCPGSHTSESRFWSWSEGSSVSSSSLTRGFTARLLKEGMQ